MEEKKKKEKVKDLNQLLSKLDKKCPEETEQQKTQQIPEVLNKNSRFPTFR
jgi:hypothetical protein